MDTNALYDHNTCRASVIQLIAEKSVNCSLMSLPKVNPGMPTCGPLEGLALMYVLREQGYLVTVNSTLLHKFESTLVKHCPLECYRQYFATEVVSDVAIDFQTANQFVTSSGFDVSIVKFRYRAEPNVKTRRYVPSLTVFVNKLGSVLGLASFLFLILIGSKEIIASVSRRRQSVKRDSRKL